MHSELFPYAPHRDVYRLLRIDADAGEAEAIAACRRLARTFHPDRNTSARAHEEMQIVNSVRRLVTDPRARAAYNEERRRWLASGSQVAAARGTAPAPQAVPEPDDRPAARLPRRMPSRLRALGVALVATVDALRPARCRSCRGVTGHDDVYCPACGTRLIVVEREA